MRQSSTAIGSFVKSITMCTCRHALDDTDSVCLRESVWVDVD